jgi:hypothetical protein
MQTLSYRHSRLMWPSRKQLKQWSSISGATSLLRYGAAACCHSLRPHHCIFLEGFGSSHTRLSCTRSRAASVAANSVASRPPPSPSPPGTGAGSCRRSHRRRRSRRCPVQRHGRCLQNAPRKPTPGSQSALPSRLGKTGGRGGGRSHGEGGGGWLGGGGRGVGRPAGGRPERRPAELTCAHLETSALVSTNPPIQRFHARYYRSESFALSHG